MTNDAQKLNWCLGIGLVVALSLGSSSAFAQTIRCRSGVVAHGDSTSRVHAVCGFPTEESTETITEWIQRRLGDGSTISIPITRTVAVWTFDFGARRLRQQLVIDGGIVTAIRELGYGVDRPVRVDGIK